LITQRPLPGSRQRNAEFGKDVLGLVFVNIHVIKETDHVDGRADPRRLTEGALRHAVLVARIGALRTRLVFRQDADDLPVCES